MKLEGKDLEELGSTCNKCHAYIPAGPLGYVEDSFPQGNLRRTQLQRHQDWHKWLHDSYGGTEPFTYTGAEIIEAIRVVRASGKGGK